MIIDDDPLQVQLLESIFLSDGYQVSGFRDSQAAMDRVRLDLPDLILTDLIMPRIDGFEVIRRLKADAATREIPVLLLTARHDQQTESEGFRLGAVDYITKPFAAPVVKARVRAQLELKRHRDQLEELVRLRTAELSRSQQQFKDLVEKSLVGIAIFIDGRLNYQNPELCRIIQDLDQKVAQRDFSFLHHDDRPKLQEAYLALVAEHKSHVEIDFRIIRPLEGGSTAETTWINARAVRFTYNDRNAIMVNIADISHAKEMERLLLIRNKMSSLGRIASGMAHEIRNPLTGITAYLYTLEQLCQLKTFLPKDVALMAEIVGQLKLGSHKVDAVIKRVLDFAKPTIPMMAPIDVNQCVHNVLNLTAATFRKAGIQVDCALASDLAPCYGDAGLIEQVILNLIQNAARAVPLSSRKKRIGIRTFARLNQVCIDLSDSGPGVPADLKEKIFDPFFTTHSDGSGIGLSIAQRIVTDHNGTLALDEGDLGGARFTVAVPIEKRKINR